MSVLEIVLILTWVIIAMLGSFGAVAILHRRGRSGLPFAVVTALGALGAFPLFVQGSLSPEWRIIGVACLFLACLSLLGLRRPRLPKHRCWSCGYDFHGETGESSTRCPECGEPRQDMFGHCLECRADLSQAIAGGSDTCPHCGTRIPEPAPGQRRYRP